MSRGWGVEGWGRCWGIMQLITRAIFLSHYIWSHFNNYLPFQCPPLAEKNVHAKGEIMQVIQVLKCKEFQKYLIHICIFNLLL